MPKKPPKNATPEPQQAMTDEQLEQYVVSMLQEQAKAGDYKAIETLGRFKRYDWFARPQPVHSEVEMSEDTAKRIAELAERMAAVNLSVDEAKAILQVLETHTSQELQAANLNINGLRQQVKDHEHTHAEA